MPTFGVSKLGAKALQQAVKPADKAAKPSATQFQNVLQKKAVKEAQTPTAASDIKQATTAPAPRPSPVKELLSAYLSNTQSMDKIMNTVLKGDSFTPGQLLMLQSSTFKTTFELDAMSKLMETASGAVKTTMQTQV